jgi:hypothetical protein
MKKLFFLFLISLLILPCAFGIEIEDRTFEIVMGAGYSFSNDFLSAGDIFSETVILDLNDLKDGFRMNLGMELTPFGFNYNNKRGGWGFGFYTKSQAMGIFNLSGKMLNLYETIDKDDGISEISGAVFVEAGVPVHFTYNKFRIKIKPALFFPLLYATSDITYTYTNTGGGTTLNLGYDVNIYTPIPIEGSTAGLSTKPGFDFYLGVEYPISEVLKLNKLPLLDFDVGLDLFGVPFIAGSMNDYMRMKGTVGSDKPIKLFGEDTDMDSFVSIAEAVYGKEKRKIYRPFKLLVWADWRPLGTELITVRPSTGFAYSSIYNKPLSMEAGIKATLNLKKLFIFSIGTGYHDRLWKNGFDLALNLRAVEFDFGMALCSPGFKKSWSGSGFAINTGLKFGW